MIAELTIFPSGKSESLSEDVARAIRVIRESGLTYELHAMGTTVEGGLDEILDVAKRAHLAVRATCARVHTTIRIDDREGAHDEIRRKVESVKAKMGEG